MRETAEPHAAESIYWCVAPVLLLASQLSSAQVRSADELRQRLVGQLDAFVSSARARGISDADAAEARYALVAFMDEQVLKSDWAGRADWMKQPLQLLLYKEYSAGENFFERMRVLSQAGGRTDALEVYYLCLTMGFRGASSSRDGSRTQLSDVARQRLGEAYEGSHRISPNGTPKSRARPELQARWPLWLWLAGCAIASLAVWGALTSSVTRHVDAAVEAIHVSPSPP